MKWPTTLSLYFLPRMTFASCTTSSGKEISNIDCKHGAKLCEEIGGACLMKMDGFTVQVLVCTVLGLIWLVYYSGYLTKLGGVPSSDWLIVKKSRASDVDDNEKQF